MREAAFVKQNIERWQTFEEELNRAAGLVPDRKAEMFVQLMDDLSFAQTQYPGSETASYLNHLSARVHAGIYKNKREERSRFITFWTRELPELARTMNTTFLYSFLITAVSAAIGAVSTLHDETFVRLILGDEYVNMTLENIRQGNPTGVYASSDQITMFFYITFNNIRVSFVAFALGLLLSAGTGWLLFRNGLMIGVFFTLFYKHNLFAEAVTVVMLHGTIELSALVLAGAAGLRMGNAILFPGTYSRYDSFIRGAREGLKLVIGLIPFFIVAGFIESFVTRYSGMPAVVKWLIILLSAISLFYYFFIYPYRHYPHGKAGTSQGS